MKQYALPIAFCASMLAVGLPYWLVPYNTLNLPEGVIHPGLFVVSFSALLLCSSGAPFWRVVGIIGATVPAAVFARVVVDGIQEINDKARSGANRIAFGATPK